MGSPTGTIYIRHVAPTRAPRPKAVPSLEPARLDARPFSVAAVGLAPSFPRDPPPRHGDCPRVWIISRIGYWRIPMSTARPSLRSRLLRGSLLLSVVGSCGPLEDVRPPVRDYVPPVLLSAPDPGPGFPDPEGTRAFRDAVHRLRSQLQSFVDTSGRQRGGQGDGATAGKASALRTV